MDYAIIGGTGVYTPLLFEREEEQLVKTPYGNVTCKTGSYQNRDIVFIARHNSEHKIPPHKINYAANIWALKHLGVKCIIATNAVGSANREIGVGDFVIIDQFLDFTKSRRCTFFNGENTPVVHVDVTDPYCSTLRKLLIDVGGDLGLKIHERGCYACFEGPRYETAAEIKMVGMLGGDVVGMTNVPEVVLAREAGICYAAVCVVTNMGAGISEGILKHKEVSELMAKNIDKVRLLALETLTAVPDDICCSCKQSGFSLPGMEES